MLTLIHEAAENDEVVFITSAYLDEKIDSFIVVEIDRNLVACAALHAYPDEEKAELAIIVVGAGHEYYGI